MNNFSREIYLTKKLIEGFKLDLTGLTVITECASNGYLFTPLAVCLAGGNVICLGKDSSHGLFTENKKFLLELFYQCQISADRYKIFKNQIPNAEYSKADIICNSGFIRKIERDHIRNFKRNAVIPLMWETWEYRNEDIDFKACQEFNVPVIGTNESYPLINMFDYNFYIALKLLFNLNIEINNSKIVLLGGHKTGESIAKRFFDLGLNFKWFTNIEIKKSTYESNSYKNLRSILELDALDVILCCEHSYNKELIGNNGCINFSEIREKHPNIVFGHICGNIDVNDLKESKIPFTPNDIKPFGYMSYQAYDLGPRPVIELNVAGLKVGEIATRSLINGSSRSDAVSATLKHGIGQDFDGGFFNYKF